jgi:N-acetylmuramoyl-L-alanine amidase
MTSLALRLDLCATSAAEAFRSENSAAVDLNRDTDKITDRVSWMAVIHKYQNVAKKYPRSSVAPKARFKAARLYENLNKFSSNPRDLDHAVENYLAIAEEYPGNSLADDSVYQAAQIYNYR